MDTKELLESVLTTLGQLVGAEVAAAPSSWSRALFWLYNKMEELDWTVRFHLKPVWGEHFKNEVPTSLLTVCDLPEQVRTLLSQPGLRHRTFFFFNRKHVLRNETLPGRMKDATCCSI